ncbi:MAG: helix-turn-helix domain-containing protein [Halobacteriovoraceae bacterium]|nr:helix-turn-helix domain-containing protein [Halobacteriovoraceae bacterium]
MKLNAKKQLRLEILTQYVGGLIYCRDAMDALGVSERQLRRLVKAFKDRGIESLVHGNSGSVPPNKTSQGIETKIVRLFKSVYMGMNITHFMLIFATKFLKITVGPPERVTLIRCV